METSTNVTNIAGDYVVDFAKFMRNLQHYHTVLDSDYDRVLSALSRGIPAHGENLFEKDFQTIVGLLSFLKEMNPIERNFYRKIFSSMYEARYKGCVAQFDSFDCSYEEARALAQKLNLELFSGGNFYYLCWSTPVSK